MSLSPKCDCGHGLVRHPLRGACTRCACTWYHPNVSAVKAKARKPLKACGPAKERKAKRYNAYMHSAVWKAKRKACIAAAGGRCEATRVLHYADGTLGLARCPETDTLTAHHLTYVRFGKEIPEDLQCLCKRCHDRVSALEGRRVS